MSFMPATIDDVSTLLLFVMVVGCSLNVTVFGDLAPDPASSGLASAVVSSVLRGSMFETGRSSILGYFYEDCEIIADDFDCRIQQSDEILNCSMFLCGCDRKSLAWLIILKCKVLAVCLQRFFCTVCVEA